MTMTRIEVACYALLASAFVLAATLLVSLDARWEAEARASLVIARDNFTLLTAKTREVEEALFVLDNANQRLLIYRLDLGRKQLQLARASDVTQLFQQGGAGRSGGESGRRGGR